MTNHLIALSGLAGSGKDAVRAILEEEGYTGLAFADPIRAMLRTLLTDAGLHAGYMDARELKERAIPGLGVSYRQLAQTLGTEWGRALDANFWLRIAQARMDGLISGGDVNRFVISDCRFANEAAWVKSQGGVIWRVHREGLAPVRAHVSESEMQRIRPGRTIHNNGTLDDLRVTVLEALGVAA